MVRTQIQLTERQATGLKRLSEKRHKPVAELVRQGVDIVLSNNIEISMEERKRRALAAIGRFYSGKKDISVKHDDYLVEAYKE